MSDPLHDPPHPEGLESLRSAIAHRLSSSFAHSGRPALHAATLIDDPVPDPWRPTPDTAHIPTLTDSMVVSLTHPALMEAS